MSAVSSTIGAHDGMHSEKSHFALVVVCAFQLGSLRNCRNISIALIDNQKGETKAHA
jgi:hypothetical protein